MASEAVQIAPLGQFLSAGELLGQEALLKIDVQGYELPALRGARELLGTFRWVYVEASYVTLYEGQALADDVIRFLQHQGFKLKRVGNSVNDADGLSVQADFLFERAPSDVEQATQEQAPSDVSREQASSSG